MREPVSWISAEEEEEPEALLSQSNRRMQWQVLPVVLLQLLAILVSGGPRHAQSAR